MDSLKPLRQKIVESRSSHGVMIITVVATLMLSAGVNLITGIPNAELDLWQKLLLLFGSSCFIGSGVAFMLILSDADSVKAEVLRQTPAIGNNVEHLNEFANELINDDEVKTKLNKKFYFAIVLFVIAVLVTCFSDLFWDDNTESQSVAGPQKQVPTIIAPF